MLFDAILDNSVRTCFEKCQQFDRDPISEAVLRKVFPEGKFGHIVRMPYAEEPTEVEKIIVRIENLGPEHALSGLAADLKDKVMACKNAIDKYQEAIRSQKLAEAEEEIAKAKLRQLYEYNYLDAYREFGKANAEQIFPQIGTNARGENEPASEDQAPSA